MTKKTLALGPQGKKEQPEQPEAPVTSGPPSESSMPFWETLFLDQGQTMVSPGETFRSHTLESRVLAPHDIHLPPLIDMASRQQPELALGETLGQGGTAIVRTAHQTPLRRQVAVKSLLSSRQGTSQKADLKREAWITGMLEHPNIIPVHLLGSDDKGNPLLVMKRIEGTSWADDLAGKTSWLRHKDFDHPLEGHLHILMEICEAVAFAHAKGILHRDLKPDNVMLGSFGEVYLVDWGIAVSTDPAHKGWLPLASEVKGLFGTPSYMAPEIAMGGEIPLTQRTDIYLLGAILHEIITGAPPHKGNDLRHLLFQAIESAPPTYPEDTPQELIAICHKAMHVDPAQRFQDVESFRAALASYLKHQDSRILSQQAQDSAEQVLALLTSTPDQEAETQIYLLFGQARFGFQQALRTWKKNLQARDGLQKLLEEMIAFELSRHNAQAASLLLADLPQENPKLKQQVDDLSRSLQKSKAELVALQRFHYEHDLSVHAAPRSWLMVALAGVWGLLPLTVEILQRLQLHHVNTRDELIYSGLFVVTNFGLIVLWRKPLFQNEINKRLVMTLGVATIAIFTHWMAGIRLKLDPAQIVALESVPMFSFFAMLATSLDKRLYPLLPVYAAVLGSVLAFPALADLCVSLGNTIAFLWIALIWRKDIQAEPEHVPPTH